MPYDARTFLICMANIKHGLIVHFYLMRASYYQQQYNKCSGEVACRFYGFTVVFLASSNFSIFVNELMNG